MNCPICEGKAPLHDVVDFAKSCDETNGNYLPIEGHPIYYRLCDSCGHCFAPVMCQFTPDEFSALVYNDDYVKVDPDYVEARPKGNAAMLKRFFGQFRDKRHLDYGGGWGLLSELMAKDGWDSTSYDPFVPGEKPEGRYNLITAFEVFEHATDPKQLVSTLSDLLHEDGLILFSTLVSNGAISKNRRLTWWYASPRNGHINLFSKESLAELAAAYKFNLTSFSDGMHAFYRTMPKWVE